MNVRARFKGTYNGKRVFEWTVTVSMSNIYGTVEVQRHTVISDNGYRAIDLVVCSADFTRMLRARLYPTELETFGPQGGSYKRFLGWESMIGHLMIYEPRKVTGNLFTSQEAA